MKKFYSLLTVLFLAVVAKAQTTYTWQGANNASWAVSTNWTPTRTTPATNDILQFNDGTTKNVTSVPTQTVGKIIVTGNTTVTLQSAAGVTLTVGNATGTDFIVDAGSELVMGGSVNITLANSATATIAGTLTVSAGRTYNTNGGGSTSTAVSGTIDNSGTVTCTNSAKLSFSTGGTYIHAVNNVTLPTATWNTGSLLDVTGVTSNALAGLAQAFADITWECPGQTVTDMRFNEMTAVDNLKIVSTGTTGSLRVYSAGPSAAIPTTGNMNNFEISGGTLNLSIAGGVGALNIAGNFTMSGGTISETSTGSGQINFQGSTTQTYSKSGGTISNTINVSIANGAIVDFGTSVLDGSAGTFNLNAGGKIITANATGLNGSIQVTGTKTFNSGADYEFQGASTGTFTTTPTASTVRNLTVNNGSGNVTLAQPLAVTGTLTLTNGALTTTTTNIVTVNAGASVSGASNASFVNGPMAKIGNTAFTFPVGKVGAGLHTVGITAPSASSTIRAEYFRGDPHALSGAYGGSIIQISGCEYWTMNRSAGTGTGRVILSWETTSPCGGNWGYVGNLSTLRVARLNAGSWADDGNFSVTGGTGSGTLTSNNNTTTFSSSFALATSAIDNALPVMFADVRAYQKNNGVQIEWSNLTERDLINYTVERSTDGQNFSAVAQVLPRSNNNDKQSYTGFDAAPVNGVNFYRVRASEISGKQVYSKTLKVDMNGAVQQGFTLYPNPVTGGQLSLALSLKPGQYTIKVVNANGQQVLVQRLTHQGGSLTQTVDLPAGIKPGFYSVLVAGNDYNQSKMFVVQ